VVLLTLLALLLALIALWGEHERQREQARIASQNVATLLQGNVEALFTRVDLLLQMANASALDRLDQLLPASSTSPTLTLDANRRQQLETAAQQSLARLRSDPPGASNLPAPSPVPITGRELAPSTPVSLKLALLAWPDEPAAPGTVARQATRRLQVEGPQRIDGRWVITFERPLLGRSNGSNNSSNNNDQRPLARMQARLPVEQLEPLFDGINLGRNGAATLRAGSNLALIWRQPWPAGPVVVGDQQVSAELVQAIKASPKAGSYVAATRIDNIERINSYRKVGNYPFYLIVGLPREDFPGAWRPMELSLLAGTFVSLALAGVVSWLVYRHSRRQIDASQRSFEAIVTSSYDAIISKALDGTVLSWNPAAETIFGYSAEEMIGEPITRLIPLDRRHEEDHIIDSIRRGETVSHFETVRQRKDGSQLAVSVTISPLHDLAGHIVGASKIARDISRQKAAESQIRTLAFNDPLTGLANRRLLFDRLHQAQAASRRSKQWAALIYIDLDRFKQVNDTHGHDLGDKLLVELAKRLTQAMRGSDTVARMGGDEFVVLCPDLGSDAVQAQHSAQGLLTKISQLMHQPCDIGALHLPCAASLGLQLFLGTEADMDGLVKQADAAMYAAKELRRGVAAAQGADTSGNPVAGLLR
jgi:diguanylate cyclase (GGDEF)-like protein/PAS domain S-box-containing protein